jgi:hypothetical protein
MRHAGTQQKGHEGLAEQATFSLDPNKSFTMAMDYAQRQKFTLQIAAAAGAAAAVTALICAQAPEGDEDWEIDSATAETVENVVNVHPLFV